MNNLKVKFVYVIFLAFMFLVDSGTAEEVASELSVEELKTVAESMREVEDALFNVRIDSNSWVEKGPCSSGPWDRTPVCLSSTAFYGNISSSRARIDVHKEVLPWENGAAPYLEKSYSVSFDGEQGRCIYHSTSYNGKTFSTNKGFILPNVPIQLTSSWYDKMTGVNASLFLHFRNNPAPFPVTFSVHFEAAVEPNSFLSVMEVADTNYLNVKPAVKFKAVYQKLGEIDCIKMSYIKIGDSSRKKWWFDPNRGFALLRHDNVGEDQNRNEFIKSSINVTKLEQVAKNIWWPVEAYFVHCPREKGKAWKRITYRASNVIANDPNFDESIFTIPFPEGYSLDKSNYKTIYTGPAMEKEKK